MSLAPAGPAAFPARRQIPAAACFGRDFMLLDSALESLACAGRRFEQARFAQAHKLVADAVQIVGELRCSLDLRNGGEFAVNLDDLCDYICRQLAAASRVGSGALLEEVCGLLSEIRAIWTLLPLGARADV